MLRMMRGRFVDLASSRIDIKLSSTLMEHVLGLKLEAKPQSVGAFSSTMKSFETVRDFIAWATVSTLIDIPFALLFYLVIAWIAWPLVFIPLLGFLGMVTYIYALQQKMHELSETTYRASSLRNATLVESLTAIEPSSRSGPRATCRPPGKRPQRSSPRPTTSCACSRSRPRTACRPSSRSSTLPCWWPAST